MRLRILLTLSLSLLAAAPAYAKPPAARDSFMRISQCIRTHHLERCRNDVTAESLELYDRFSGYEVSKCLPGDARYISEERNGQHIVVHAATTARGQDRGLKLTFSFEEGRWKLDVPESLHAWLGDNWQQRVQMGEQLYLVMRTQLGDKLDCQSAQALVK